MTAYNIVRMRVKPGRQSEFEEMNSAANVPAPSGARRAVLVKTGETTYCFIGEWNSYKDIAAARAVMIADLDRFREILADLGGGLGVTYPVSGDAVIDFEPGSAPQRSPSARPAYNIARYRTKSGCEQEFVTSVKQAVDRADLAGFRRAVLVDIGSRAFVFLGEWDSNTNLTKSGASLVSTIDANRHLLEDVGGSVGAHVVSGEAVVEY